MQLTRRTFLGGAAISGMEVACRTPPGAPVSSRAARAAEDVLARALDAAKRAGATYVDARVVRRRTERVATREDHVVAVTSGETYGIGVRVIASGAWGFASSAIVSGEAAEEAAQKAVAIAR